MKITVFQSRSNVGKFEENFDRLTRVVENTSADLVLFPELFLSGYTTDEGILRRGASFLGEVLDDLITLSRKRDVAIVFGSPRIVGGKLRNSAVVIKKKREVLFYDKIHLFRSEKDVFEPGDDFLVFDFKGVRFGILICYEIGFPEVSRILAIRGAQVILALFAFGKERKNIYEFSTRARAIENGCYLASASTTGKGVMDFIGKSRVVHPSGEVISEVEEGEGTISVDVDISVIHHYRYEEMGDSHTYFSNRRPEIYRELCQIRDLPEDLL